MKQALLHACSKHESEVSLLQRHVQYWSRCWTHHLIVNLLERHLKWVCYKDMNETSSTTCM